MKETITFGSVCSGIEAASVAWAPLGWEAAWLSEIEPFPCAVLAHHYPDVPNLGDMTKIAHLIRDGFVPAPDVFCGGTPCQAFSIAGLRNSLDDARGNLSLTFCEIANEIDARRATTGLLPSVIFWENVPGVLSTKDNAFGCFLAGLAGEDDPLLPPGGKWQNAGCVFGPKRVVAWRVTDAQFFGVAQRRRRVFVVASAREGFDPTAVLFEPDCMHRNTPPSREAGQETAGTLASRTDGGGFPGTDEACSGYVQPVGGVLRGGNTSGPLNVAACLTAKGQRIDFEVETFAVQPALSVALRGREGGATAELGDEVAGCPRASTGGGDKPHVLAPMAQAVAYNQVLAFKPGQSEAAGGIFVTEDYAPTLQAQNNGSTAAPAVCDITHTLKAEGFDASEDGTGRGQPIVAQVVGALACNTGPNGHDAGNFACNQAVDAGHVLPIGMAVRRLTPRECERLQGFPDNYLGQVKFRGKPAADGPMYKALGNSWAVPNVRWIGARIDRHLRALSGAAI